MASSSVGGESHDKKRPLDLDLTSSGPLEDSRASDGAGSKANTPAGMSSSATSGTTGNIISTGDINEFQMYQRFRLKMVEMFGSLASALYEFGADPATGQISRSRFEEVCTTGLNLMPQQEANLLFSHVTNADPMDLGMGGFATFKSFSIKESEWKFVVNMKEKEKRGEVGAMPFASGPSGSSMGLYHRPMQVDNFASCDQGGSSGGLGGMLDSKTSMSRGGQSRSSPSRRSRGKPYAWRQRQKPWMGSIFAGEADAEADKLKKKIEAQRGRPSEFFFQTAGKATFVTDHPKHAQMGASPRKTAHDVGYLVQQCPPRREEMEPEVCVKQVDGWWPYSAQAPPRKLPITLPRCRLAEAQLSARVGAAR